MPEGGPVTLSLQLQDNMAAIMIKDTGFGMSTKELERAFSPFYSTKEDGYGLGLAMIKKILAYYDGGIKIASTPGKGTTVTILFCPVLGAYKIAGPRDADTPNQFEV